MAAYFIKHTKEPEIKFLGHLNLQTSLQRTISRADIGIQYSKGFNPHMELSSAQPLPVGASSQGEYLRVELETDLAEAELLERLCQVTPPGIQFLDLWSVGPKTKAPMALLDAVATRIHFSEGESFAKALEDLLRSEEDLVITVTNKKGNRYEKNIRDYILPGFVVKREKETTLLEVKSLAGSRGHLNLEHLLMVLDERIGLHKDRFIHLHRLEMYTRQGTELVPMRQVK